MTTFKRIVLGVEDPEMKLIETIANAAGISVAYAIDEGGTRVVPQTAYKAVYPEVRPTDLWVECRHKEPVVEATYADHHRPGDYGYGAAPGNFLAASSLGQVLLLLAPYLPETVHTEGPERQIVRMSMGPLVGGTYFSNDPVLASYSDGACEGPDHWSPVWVLCHGHTDSVFLLSQRLVTTAAADHCPTAAYAGKCLGVSGANVLEQRLLETAERRSCPPSALREQIELDKERLESAPVIVLGDEQIADLRNVPMPTVKGVGSTIVEAAMWAGKAYLAVTHERGRRKVVLGGCGEGSAIGIEPVREFLGSWAKAQGLIEQYGDPIRGYAGAYIVEQS
jgi:hypothetical protein